MKLSASTRLIAGVSGGLVTTTSIVSDFLMPIAPYGLYIGLTIFIVFSISLVLASIPLTNQIIKSKLQSYWYFPTALTLILSSTFITGAYYASKNVGENKNGILSTYIPEFSSIQKNLGIISEETKKIRESVANIDKNTAKISEKVGYLKNETSKDPRKEISNLGLKWSVNDFSEVLFRGDIHLIKLYFEGGMRIPDFTEERKHHLFLEIFKNNKTNIDEVYEIISRYQKFSISTTYYAYPFTIDEVNSIYTELQIKASQKHSNLIRSWNYSQGPPPSIELPAFPQKVYITPFIMSIWSSNYNAIEWLTKKGIDINTRGYISLGDKTKIPIDPIQEAQKTNNPKIIKAAI